MAVVMYVRVVRVAGPGQPQGKGLSGEEEIVQSLLEGINTVAYPKALVTRKVLKVSRAAAEAAMSAAAAAGTSTSSCAPFPGQKYGSPAWAPGSCSVACAHSSTRGGEREA